MQTMTKLLLFLGCLGSVYNASAQYKEILKPEMPQSAALYKKNHVSFFTYAERKETHDSIYSISAVDSSGYILLRRDVKSVHYFDYDNSGLLINRLDTFKIMGQLEVYSYSASYQDFGLLNALELPTGTSVFRFYKDKNLLSENFLPKGGKIFCKNTYKYDAAHRLVYEELHDSIGRPYQDHSYTYDAKGNLVKEETNTYLKGNAKNYIGYIYSYNSNGQLTGTQINIVENYGTADDETGEKHIPRYNTISESFQYDKAGNLIKKTHADAKNAILNYTMTYEYLPNGLKRFERTFNKKGELKNTMVYDYKYYGKQ